MKDTMVEQDSTERLVERAKSGDKDAFDQLAERFRRRLGSSVEAWSKFQLGPKLDPDDTIQETFVRAHRALPRFEWDGDDSFFRWLCGIAKRALAQMAEDARKARPPSTAADVPVGTPCDKHIGNPCAARQTLPPATRLPTVQIAGQLHRRRELELCHEEHVSHPRHSLDVVHPVRRDRLPIRSVDDDDLLNVPIVTPSICHARTVTRQPQERWRP